MPLMLLVFIEEPAAVAAVMDDWGGSGAIAKLLSLVLVAALLPVVVRIELFEDDFPSAATANAAAAFIYCHCEFVVDNDCCNCNCECKCDWEYDCCC